MQHDWDTDTKWKTYITNILDTLPPGSDPKPITEKFRLKYYKQHIDPDFVPASTAADEYLRSFPVGPLQCNCSIVGNRATKEAIICDPGGDAADIMKLVKQEGFKVSHIFVTHAHFDHIMAAGEIHRSTGAPICLHKGDDFLYSNLATQCGFFGFPAPTEELPRPHHWLEDGQVLGPETLKWDVIHTPGHTPGSTCFFSKQRQLLLAGDTLFRGSVGRSDLPGGDGKALVRSIREKLYVLPDDTTVVAGHGPNTTIGDEKKNNAVVRASPNL